MEPQASSVTVVADGANATNGAADAELLAKPADDARDPADVNPYADVPEYTKLQFAVLFLGLALAVFLASLDQLIVSVAVPRLITEFQTVSGISWIYTAYLLTATPSLPVYGKVSDIFGRKPAILFAMVAFEVGSAICGAATSMTMFIVGRAIAGLGGGGIFSLVLIIISDVVPLRDRPKYQGVIGAVFGLSSVLGPLLGGLFTESSLTWRWCFYINLPIGAVSVFVSAFFLKLPKAVKRMSTLESIKRLDFLGAFLCVAGIIFFLIPLSLGGTDYDWNSGFVIGFFVACVVTLAAFFYVEARVAVDPIVPLRLFSERNTAVVLVCSFFFGMSFLTTVAWVPTYLQVVNGDSAVQSGINMLPLVAGLVTMSVSSGAFMSLTGYYQPLIPLGATIVIVGSSLLYTLDENSPRAQQFGFFVIQGLGIGLNVQTIVVAAQASARESDVAVVTANAAFWRQIGITIGIQIASSVFLNRLTSGLAEYAPLANLAWVRNNPSALRNAPPVLVPPSQVAGVIHAYVQAITTVFMLGAPFAGLLFLTSWLVKKDKLPKAHKVGGGDVAA